MLRDVILHLCSNILPQLFLNSPVIISYNLKDKTIGIVGVGNVGSKVEKTARILGMKVLLNDPPRARKEGNKDFVPLGNILYESDIVTVHVPLNIVGADKTYHLFNTRVLER